MKSITFKEVANQLTHPDFDSAILLKKGFKSDSTSDISLTDSEIKFYFDSGDPIIFRRNLMDAKTDGSSVFMIDMDGNNYEIKMFKTVQMTF